MTHKVYDFDLGGSASLDALTTDQWAEVIQSLVKEDIEHDCGVHNKPITVAAQALSHHGVSSRLQGFDHRTAYENGEVLASMSILNHLPKNTKEKMRVGFNKAISILADSKVEGWADVLRKTIIFGLVLGGTLRRTSLDKALSRKDLPPEMLADFSGIRRRVRR